MHEREELLARRILTLVKLDAKRLFERIRDRELEYLSIFSQRRTREHFKEIFISKFDNVSIGDLKHCSEDVIIALDAFYTKVDEMKWYLYHTEDMPITVDDRVRSFIRELSSLYQTLDLFINAELQIEEEEMSVEDIEETPETVEISFLDNEDEVSETEDDRSPTKNLAGEDTLLGEFNKEDLKDL